ncbi:hypothetical protein Bpfe_026481, partial [Biomphalaria pfeifferi]
IHLSASPYAIMGYNVQFKLYLSQEKNYKMVPLEIHNIYGRDIRMYSYNNSIALVNVNSTSTVLTYPDYTITLDILVTDKGYQFYTNKTYCCFYPHYLHFEPVKYLGVYGYMQIYELSY